MREIVEDGVSGFVVPYGDIEAAAEAVKEAYKLNPFACYRRALMFSDVAMAQAHLQVYQQVREGARWK